MKQYIIGVDGGGTKTLGVLFDLEGKELKRVTKGYGNFCVNASDTICHLKEVLVEITNDIDKSLIAMIEIGIAGYLSYPGKESLIKDLEKQFNTELSIVTDAEIALYSVKKYQKKDTIMVLGGTGSVVMVEQNNDIKFIGGYGHLLGDEGSGYHLAIKALKNIIDQHEEADLITPLTKSILKEIGTHEYREIKLFVYNNPKSVIATLSNFIANHAINNDLEAIKLFVDEGKLLAKQTISAYKILKSKDAVLIGIKGGFLLNAPYVKETLIKELNKAGLKYIMDETPLEPVFGAYYLAKRNLEKRQLYA